MLQAFIKSNFRVCKVHLLQFESTVVSKMLMLIKKIIQVSMFAFVKFCHKKVCLRVKIQTGFRTELLNVCKDMWTETYYSTRILKL